jgi:hypothetical protein
VSAPVWLPDRADLEAATARTAAAIADPSASLGDVELAAELEQAVYEACPADVVAAYEAETEAELEAGA